jgi:hypothetical protein
MNQEQKLIQNRINNKIMEIVKEFTVKYPDIDNQRGFLQFRYLMWKDQCLTYTENDLTKDLVDCTLVQQMLCLDALDDFRFVCQYKQNNYDKEMKAAEEAALKFLEKENA